MRSGSPQGCKISTDDGELDSPTEYDVSEYLNLPASARTVVEGVWSMVPQGQLPSVRVTEQF